MYSVNHSFIHSFFKSFFHFVLRNSSIINLIHLVIIYFCMYLFSNIHGMIVSLLYFEYFIKWSLNWYFFL